MLKLFYLFLTKSLSGSYKKQTILKPKLLFLNQLEFKSEHIFGLNFFFLSLVLFLLLFAASCSTTEPPDTPLPPPVVEEPVLTLELDDAHCTEAWLILKTEKLTLPAELTLKQYNPSGDSLSQIFVLNTQDSLLYIDSLLPNQTYNYQLSCIWYPAADSQQQAFSNTLTVKTMDTTSHNFTFETFTFGEGTGSSSILYDVAIIDENNIWAVGEIWVADTSSLGYTKYNAVHWDGNKWELKRIYYYGSCSAVEYPPLMAIWAFSESDLVITNGGSIGWFNGTNVNLDCRINPLLSGEIKKIWGSSSNNLYIVGGAGNIAHYNGTSWAKIESGTTLNINDIWGDYNEKIQEWEILAVASNKFFNEGYSILKIDGNISTELNNDGLPWSLSSIWFEAGNKYFIGGDGLYFNKKINEKWSKDTLFIPIYKDRIRGRDINDIVVSGSNGLYSHFNGVSWKHFINDELPFYSGRLLSVDIKNNITAAVGWKENQAIITIGRR